MNCPICERSEETDEGCSRRHWHEYRGRTGNDNPGAAECYRTAWENQKQRADILAAMVARCTCSDRKSTRRI